MNDRPKFIDGWGARMIAFLVIISCTASLAYLHRKDLWPDPVADIADSNPQLASCFEDRFAAVEKMRADGVIGDDQYAVFRARAEAFCQQQFGEANVLPPAR